MLTWRVFHKDCHIIHSYRYVLQKQEFVEVINGRPIARVSKELKIVWEQTNSI